MNKLIGKKVAQLPATDLRKVADLTYFDGPLLSLFRDAEERSYLYYWCDADEMYNRWLVLRITEEQLALYIKQTLPLYEMIVHPSSGELFVVDIDSQSQQCAVVLTQPNQLPADYLPQKDARFDPNTTVFYEQDTIKDVISFLLDEVHHLRQAKLGYPPYDPRQLSTLPVHMAAAD